MQDTEKTTEEIEDGAFEQLPEEVQDFLGSPLFDNIIKAIQEALNLTDEQAGLVRYLSYEMTMKTMTSDEGFHFLTDHQFDEETAVKILYAIGIEIITRAINITEFYTEDMAEIEDGTEDEAEPADASEINANLSHSLETLADRLKQVSIATPAKRDYSLDRSTVAKPAIDPYHEQIDQ